jgi:carboxyl-terminal processing protease
MVLDLRGHIGGGLGVLRLMSHLTARKVPIGYTVTRKRAEKGYNKEELPKLDRLPTNLPNPIAIAAMALKFAGRDLSVALISEGLGEKRWHGRLAVLINEHTISAGEMVAAFVRDYRLGNLIGARTPGRLVPAAAKNVGHGYMVVLPRAKYTPWLGPQVEGDGISPDIYADWQDGSDKPLAEAISALTASAPTRA